MPFYYFIYLFIYFKKMWVYLCSFGYFFLYLQILWNIFLPEVSANHWSCYLLKSVTQRDTQTSERPGSPQQFLSLIPKLRHRLCSQRLQGKVKHLLIQWRNCCSWCRCAHIVYFIPGYAHKGLHKLFN